MFICCIVDFKNQPISEELLNTPQFREKIIKYVKLEMKELREIDKIIRELSRIDEDFSYYEDISIIPVQFHEKLNRLDLGYEGVSFIIPRAIIEKLSEQFRILYVVECTIFVPILSAPKWIKGLIREKDFEMQILAPGFTLEDKKFHLEILEFESEESEKLRELAGGRLVILYLPLSQVNEEW